VRLYTILSFLSPLTVFLLSLSLFSLSLFSLSLLSLSLFRSISDLDLSSLFFFSFSPPLFLTLDEANKLTLCNDFVYTVAFGERERRPFDIKIGSTEKQRRFFLSPATNLEAEGEREEEGEQVGEREGK